jgi:hypothetical protein
VRASESTRNSQFLPDNSSCDSRASPRPAPHAGPLRTSMDSSPYGLPPPHIYVYVPSASVAFGRTKRGTPMAFTPSAGQLWNLPFSRKGIGPFAMKDLCADPPLRPR